MMKKVSILLAIYNPNIEWLEKLLGSINSQTYNNIEVLVCDDCSPNINFEVIDKLVKTKINKFPVSVYQNKKNQGCTKTFNDLAQKSQGDYISFCDQDDIWENEKISQCVEVLDTDKYTLAYCKACVINENNDIIDQDWNIKRKHANIGEGETTYIALLFRNWIAGCFMLVKSDIIKKAIPFDDNICYDQWVALIASLEGDIAYVPNTLIRYRRHQNTQTGSFVGVNSKTDYKKKYIDVNYNFVKQARERIQYGNNEVIINNAINWCEHREKWWEKFNFSSMLGMIKGIKFDKKVVIFEMFLARMPESIFNKVICLIKEGKL